MAIMFKLVFASLLCVYITGFACMMYEDMPKKYIYTRVIPFGIFAFVIGFLALLPIPMFE